MKASAVRNLVFSDPHGVLRYYVELRYSRSAEDLVKLAVFLREQLALEERKDLLRVLPWDKAEKIAGVWGMRMPPPEKFYGAPPRTYERRKPKRKLAIGAA